MDSLMDAAHRGLSAQPQPGGAATGGSGEPMPAAVQARMEQSLGADFSGVRIHQGDQATSLGALAYTQGADIHFAPGQYDPASQRGQELLGHELAHVVQQREGRVHATTQAKGAGVAVNDSPALEREADDMGARAARGEPARAGGSGERSAGAGHPGSAPAVQMRRIPDLTALRKVIVEKLDQGEAAAGSSERFISREASNVAKLFELFTPGMASSDLQTNSLKRSVGNDYKEGWFDRVAARVQEGAEHLARAVLFWQQHLARRDNVDTDVLTVHLMGSDLHERGLGAARVDYLQDYGSGMFARLRCMLKPEDRSIEDALIGVDGSLAEQLNRQVPRSRRVPTLAMDTNPQHGTIMEYVEPGLTQAATAALRKLGALYDSESVAMETIALAFLGGIWDLHHENVMLSGGAPVLIDADVAMRPTEFKEGPDTQAGFNKTPNATERVKGQLAGDGSGASVILQYAIEHPEEVVRIIRSVIGDKVARVVPVFTGDWTGSLQIYVMSMADGEPGDAHRLLSDLAKAVAAGRKGSKGLQGELGEDRKGAWDPSMVEKLIAKDFEQGQIPYFNYQPSSGQVTYQSNVIWVGEDLDDSMRYLQEALRNGKGTKKNV
jgi:hypothetical protein